MNQSVVGTTPPEVMSPDHPLFGLDVERLTTSDRAWLQTQFSAVLLGEYATQHGSEVRTLYPLLRRE